MTDTNTDLAAIVSDAGGTIDQVAGFLLARWIGNQAYGSTLTIVADADTLRPDGALTTIEADLFSVGEEPHGIRIIATGIRDAEGMRIISADVHAPVVGKRPHTHGGEASPHAAAAPSGRG